MIARSAVLLGALAAGCATSAPTADPPPPPEATIPEVLQGLPPAVVAGRALLELESGVGERADRARAVLLALPAGAAVEPLRERARSAPARSALRLDALAVLAERGESLEEFAREDVMEMCLREIGRRERSGRAAILAVDRIRGMGEPARRYLEARASGAGSAADLARRVLGILGAGGVAAAIPRP